MLPALRGLHLVEIVIFLACLWWIGRVLFEDEVMAWLTAALGLCFRELFDFANVVMTEPLYAMLYGVFAAVLVTAYARAIQAANGGWGWWLATGLCLGAVVLVKTSAAVLAIGLPLLIIVMTILYKRPVKTALVPALCILAGVGVWVAAWMARSGIELGTLAMTDPGYLEASLSHRLAYNRMSWGEWLGGWIYYLPDFGDNAANALFGDGALEALSFGPQGYYHYGFFVLHPQAHAVTAPDYATGYLIRTYAIGEPIKFAAVSALLTWRGLFVGRLFGMVGLAALGLALWQMTPRQRELLALLALLAFALAGVHGALSVGIPRYNLAFIPVYALSLAWLLGRLWSVAFSRSEKGRWRIWRDARHA